MDFRTIVVTEGSARIECEVHHTESVSKADELFAAAFDVHQMDGTSDVAWMLRMMGDFLTDAERKEIVEHLSA